MGEVGPSEQKTRTIMHPGRFRDCLCNPKKIIMTKPTSSELLEKCKELILTNIQLKKIKKLMLEHIQRGLGKATHPDAIVKCFVTYVQDLPTGKEIGKFLALDLGGTNFRVLLIELKENVFEMRARVYGIPEYVQKGSGVQLMDHIIGCLNKFVKEQNLFNEKLPLGFTFSFPLKQTKLNAGILTRWTKGFNCEDMIGQEIGKMFEEALVRGGLNHMISLEAIINDTVGTLIACAWKSSFCRIGVIIGTGNNACYVEKQKKAEMFDAPNLGSGNVIINCELGAFGDDGILDFIRTQYDKEVDENTEHVGKQIHEKMVAGMYLGELARLVIQRFTNEGILFGGKGSDKLFTRFSLNTSDISKIESDEKGMFVRVKQVLGELGLEHATEDDFKNVRFICECISRRSAHIISAGLCAIMTKMGEKRVTIGIDGSLYRYHPHFHKLMMEKMSELNDSKIIFDIMLSDDGSGKGAALIAAVASKYAS